MSGNYNDYIDRFDAKDFEKLAREYAKKYQNNGSIMGLNDGQSAMKNENNFAQNDGQNIEQFFANFESLIGTLIEFDFDSIYSKKYTNFASKNIKKNIEINALTKSLCKTYFELKGEPYFCPINSHKKDLNNSKNLHTCISPKRLINRGKDGTSRSSNCLDNTYKNCLTNEQNIDDKNLVILALAKDALWELNSLKKTPAKRQLFDNLILTLQYVYKGYFD